MSQTFLTDDIITAKALQILENKSVITRTINKEYDPSFAVEGAKIGTTLRIRLPDRMLVTDGAALQVQDVNQQFTTLTVATQKHIGLTFTTADRTMKIDNFADLFLKPRISQLATSVDAAIAQASYKKIYASVGTPGTTPATSAVLLAAQQKLNEMACPEGMRYAAVNPAANAALVEGMKGLFNPGSTISSQFKSGMMGEDVLGYDEIAMTQNIPNHTTGTRTGAHTVTSTVSTQGQATINITGSSTQTIAEGDVFTIDGVFAVNPQTRESTGSLQQFVCTALNTAAAGSYTNVAISPAIYTSTHALATVNAFPQANAVVTFLGSASTSYPQNLVYHKNAITMATADLVLPQNLQFGSRQVHNGISLRIAQQYDINNDRLPMRADVLFGSNVIRPEMAVRVWG
jgi:hypothetical protein